MSAGDRDMLAALLAEHQERQRLARGVEECLCGESAVGDPGWYRRHRVDVLLASGWLTGAKAGAWDEGFRAGYGRDGAADNPYRTTEDA